MYWGGGRNQRGKYFGCINPLKYFRWFDILCCVHTAYCVFMPLELIKAVQFCSKELVKLSCAGSTLNCAPCCLT